MFSARRQRCSLTQHRQVETLPEQGSYQYLHSATIDGHISIGRYAFSGSDLIT